jgi:thiamine kinase-like enzyme
MAGSLPGNIQLKLDQTLAQWRHWDCDPPLASRPEVRQLLGSGLSNFSVLVAAPQQFVVRLDGSNPLTNGLNRQAEWRSLQAAAQAGIAARPCYFNPELGSLVCAYLPPDEHGDTGMRAVARLLQRIHQLPPRHHRLDLAERMLAYEKHLAQRADKPAQGLLRLGGPVRQQLQRASEKPSPPVLCHNDLLRANRVSSGGRLWAIDWEYSAMGSHWYDLAVVAAGDELDGGETADLVRTYLGRPPTPAESTTLERYGCVYRYLELLWYLTQETQYLSDSAVQQRLATLKQKLGQQD